MILICAATSIEASACRAGLARAKNGHSFDVLQTGMGRKAAQNALRLYLEHHSRPSLVVSSGFAGSLNEDAHIGSWVCGTSIRDGFSPSEIVCTTLPPAVCQWLADRCAFGRIRGVDEVVTEHGDEQHHADEAVDMESFGLLEICREHELGFSILRLISDTPSEPLPAAIKTFTAMLLTDDPRSRGRSLFKGARELLSSPKNFARFARTSSHLRTTLARDWQTIAESWPMRPLSRGEDS